MRLKRKWVEEYATWHSRSLADRTWVNIWVDIIGKLRTLMVNGIYYRGREAMLTIKDRMRKSIQSWLELLMNLSQRHMNAPQLAIGDRILRFWNALNEIWPTHGAIGAGCTRWAMC